MVAMMCVRLCLALEIDYSSFFSPEEVIAYEESRVQDSELEGMDLADAYIDLGESYLLCGHYEKALYNLGVGAELARDCQLERTFPRAFLGLAITYANMGLMEEFYAAVKVMQAELETGYCLDCQKARDSAYRIELTYSSEILGPDKISIQDCIDRVQGTADSANELISFVRRPEVQFILRGVIRDLRDRALHCCRAGGLWKACLQPLTNKWAKWNEKWKLFGIPPDPSWD